MLSSPSHKRIHIGLPRYTKLILVLIIFLWIEPFTLQSNLQNVDAIVISGHVPHILVSPKIQRHWKRNTYLPSYDEFCDFI